MEEEQTYPPTRQQAISEIIGVFDKLKFPSKVTYTELADVMLSQAASLKALYDATESSRQKHNDLKKRKEKGVSFSALEAVRRLRNHNLIDLLAHDIEIKTKMNIKSTLGLEFGLDEIAVFLEMFNSFAQEIEGYKSKAIEKSISKSLADFYYKNTGRLPSANDNDSNPNQPFEKICDSVARYLGIRITKGQMQAACRALKESTKKQGDVLKK
ncbi:MAG: hypothetical protein JNL76_05440 [Alphaproteobacteria bacterium]|nr:hypothetical protein [Alphaproteobacteria bacterium]